MIKYEAYYDVPVRRGYIKYDVSRQSLTIKYCKWWAYPIFLIAIWLLRTKYRIYFELNIIGVMKTKQGCIMKFSDIWRR